MFFRYRLVNKATRVGEGGYASSPFIIKAPNSKLRVELSLGFVVFKLIFCVLFRQECHSKQCHPSTKKSKTWKTWQRLWKRIRKGHHNIKWSCWWACEWKVTISFVWYGDLWSKEYKAESLWCSRWFNGHVNYLKR